MTEYWKGLLKDVEPCYFPTLNDNEHSESKARTTEVLLHKLCKTRQLLQLCELEGISPPVVFQLAWALVLKCYTSTDSICFACFVSEHDYTTNRDLGGINPLPGLLVCCAQLTNDPIINLLRELQAKFGSSKSQMVRTLVEIGQMVNIFDK